MARQSRKYQVEGFTGIETGGAESPEVRSQPTLNKQQSEVVTLAPETLEDKMTNRTS